MNASKVTNSGPFGTAQRGTTNHILNALNHFGIPLGVIQGVEIGNSNITLHDEIVGEYRYFDGIEQPLFFIHDKHYMKNPVVVDPETGISKPVFRLTLSPRGSPCMTVVEDLHSAAFFEFYVKKLPINGHQLSPGSLLKVNSAAVLNEYTDTYEHKRHSCVEFWDNNHAQAFVDYVNENYNVQSGLEQQQVFSVWTYAHRIASHAKYSNYFSRVKDTDKNTVAADFDNIVDANELFSAVQALNVQVFKNFTTS